LSAETISTMEWGADSEEGPEIVGATEPAVVTEPFGWLPRRSYREIRLERWLASWGRAGRVPPFLDWLEAGCGGSIAVKPPEIHGRASGLNRPGMIAQLTAPRLATRLAVGIENVLAHTVVDRLLGFDRPFAESRLQLTPVEWGVWTFLILRALEAMEDHSGGPGAEHPDGFRSLRPADLTLDRAGPDPFDPTGLGPIVTIRWAVRIGTTVGAVRLWLPESVAERWLDSPPKKSPPPRVSDDATEPEVPGQLVARGEISSLWRAEAGSVAMPQGLKRLRVGGVLPLTDSRLAGSPASPGGPIDLILDLDGEEGRYRIPARPVPDSGGRLVRIEETPRHESRPRDPILVNVKESRTMSPSGTSPNPAVPATDVGPLDVPVTLTVELGRVNLTLSRLADLKPGDVIELSRHSRAPVELTSNGRLVARGELILIDTDLGVRVTSVFL
jgi:type III secretion system YscQ/HrcQ family protein